jgi:methylmalonyl-CoA mutase
MEDTYADLDVFPPMDAARWQALIEKELKGIAPESLQWAPAPGLSVGPVFHRPEADYGGPLTVGRPTADWQITEWLGDESDVSRANTHALQALHMGAQAVVLPLPAIDAAATALEGIHVEMAPVFWRWPDATPPPSLAERLLPLYKGDPLKVRTGILSGTTPELHVRYRQDFQGWVSVIAEAGPAISAVEELTRMLEYSYAFLRNIPAVHEPARGLAVTLEIGPDFIVEIARLRAWRMLWGHLLGSFGLDPSQATVVFATVTPDTAMPWENTYIAATTRALSAVLGGVDYLSVLPPAVDNPAFARRIARNVQHLLKEEGHLHHVIDPMAGSYALEELTLDFARRAWEGFLPEGK